MTDQIQLSPHEVSERFNLLAMDAKEYAVFLMGLEGHLICWNTGAERIFGYTSQDIIVQHFSRFFSPEDILTGQPEHELETCCPMMSWEVYPKIRSAPVFQQIK